MDNYVTVIGNATRDPELRYTAGATAVASFGLAVNKRRFDKTANEYVEEPPSFFNCTAWRDLGEHVAGSIVKGQRVIVVGELKQRSWEDDQGGKHSVVEIIVSACGPDLRWGQATFEKAERTQGNQGRSDTPGGQTTRPNREPDPIYGDEEPF